MSAWEKRTIHWTDGENACISVVFTWDLPQAYSLAVSYKRMGFNVLAGGPAVRLMPAYLAEVAEVADVYGQTDALTRHNPNATFTTRGCPNACRFCGVKIIDGAFIELPEFIPRPIVCDPNFLACSKNHFDRATDKLSLLNSIDFNQGLDARLLTVSHLDGLKKLDLALLRFAWDKVNYESSVMAAIEMTLNAGYSKSKIRVYVLINDYDDTPSDALYRCTALKRMGILPSVQRFQPLDTLQKDSFISPNWTKGELTKFTRYWSRQVYLGPIPYAKFSNSIRHRTKDKISDRQLSLEVK